MSNPMLAKDTAAAWPGAAFERILVPFDFSEPAAHALAFAKKLSAAFGAVVEVLYVVPHLPNAVLPIPELGAIPVPTATVDDMLENAKDRLHEALAQEDGSSRLEETVRIGDPRAQILAHAAAEKADLIVMGTHGRTGASRLLLGSVAERVVREATCPVLTVH